MKKLLFIGLDYHGYTRAIIEEFKGLGYEVTFHEIEPWTTLRKVYRRLSPDGYRRMRERYHRRIISETSGQKFDVVFFLQVHQFSMESLDLLKAAQPAAEFVLYYWDSVVGLANMGCDYRPYLGRFDRALTFDHHDAETLDIDYLPLFCTREFQGRETKSERSSVYFVGNLENARRYRAVHAFGDFCRANGIPFRTFMRCRVRIFLHLIREGIIPKDIRFDSISRSDFLEMLDGATAVFDFANHDQSGFTMRVMENLCAGKKVITNNKMIREEVFYTQDRILVFDQLNFVQVMDFLEIPISSPNSIFEIYYVQNFARRLLGMPLETAG